MTVSLVATIHVFSGLSTDTKPTSDVRTGSTFYELDTGRTFRLGDGEAWKEDKSIPLSTGQYQQSNSELRRLIEQTLLEVSAANLANGIEVR